MSTPPFGAPGFGFSAFDPTAFERLGRQWMDAFGAPAATPEPFAWWAPSASHAPTGAPPAAAAQWLSWMQQVAAQFVGREAGAADIVRAWRSLVGDNPFAHVAGAFSPAAFAAGPRRGPFDFPAFGYTREHQERAQAFARAVSAWQQASQAFGAVVAEAGQDAFERFESLLATRGGDGKPVESARALFDLWIDAAEDAYADVASGERFQKAFGDYVNAQTRVRAAMQEEVELASAQWGIPGRSEVDAAHRKVAEMERELRRLKDRIAAMEERAGSSPPAAGEARGTEKKAGARKRSGR